MSREMRHSGIEWIGEIPNEWKIVKLRNLGFFSASGIDKKTVEGEDPVHIVNYVDVYNNLTKELRKRDYMLVTAPRAKCQEHQLNIGDMIFTPSSETIEDIGVSCVVMEELENTAYSYHVIRFRSYENIDLNYKKYFTNNQAILNYFSSCATGTIRKTISREIFKECLVVLPPLSEQQKIANYLDKVCEEVDEMIALQEQMIEELKAYKQSVITEAVTKGLNPNAPMKDSASREQNHACMNYAEAQPVFERKFKDSGIDWIGEIPEHWKVTVLRRFATIILGKMLQPNAKSDDDTLEQYICAKDVHFEGIDFSDLKKMYFDKNEKETYQVQKGDMLVVEGGAGAAGSCVLKTDLPDTYIQNSIMIVRPKQGIDIRYIQYFEFSLVKKGYVDFVCNKATIPHFTKDKLSSMPIPLPPLSEQQTIASYLDTKCAEIDALIAIKQAKIEELKEYKKSVIYEYVTGKKEVV